MIDQVRLEHETPLPDDIKEVLLEGPDTEPEPLIEDVDIGERSHLVIECFVGIYLGRKRGIDFRCFLFEKFQYITISHNHFEYTKI